MRSFTALSSRRVLTATAVTAVMCVLAPQTALATTDQTDNYTRFRSTTRVIAFANGIAGPAQIAYTVGLQHTPTGSYYYPCANPSDNYYNACSIGGYYKVVQVTPTSGLQYGLPINNQDTNPTTGTTYTHYWSQRIVVTNLEITGTDAAKVYGNARMTMSNFSFPYEGDPTHQMRTASTGVIPLPTAGAAGSGRVAGYVRRNGVPVNTVVNLDYFGHTDTQHTTSANSWIVYGFAGAKTDTSGSGYYTTRPTWNGHYDVYVKADGHVWLCGANVQGGVQGNYDLAVAGLGQGCTQQS
jgi:hypothetical protein